MAMKLYTESCVENIANILRKYGASRLPSGYVEVDYISSANGARIATGVSGNNDNLKIQLKFSNAGSVNYTAIFGNYSTESANCTRLIFSTASTRFLSHINTKANGGGVSNTNITLGDIHVVEMVQGETSFDGVSATKELVQGTANNSELSIFSAYLDASAPTTYETKMYYFKIYDNNVLIRDFVPCYRKSDGVAGLYDLVNDVFYSPYNSIGYFNVGKATEVIYKIREMAPAIDNLFNKFIDYVSIGTLNGTTNQIETINDGTELPIKNLIVNGKSSQGGVPTVSNKSDVTKVTSIVLSLEDGNQHSKTKTFDLDGNELYELQNGTKDTIYIQNGHLYVEKNVKKIQLTSSQSWTVSTANKAAYCANFATNYGIEKLNYNMYSSHFTSSSTVWDANYKFGWGASSPNTTLWVSFNSTTSEFSTKAAFKAWLDENDCYIIAKATTPETIDLGEIDDIFTYGGTNNITVTTNIGTTYALEYRKS